MAFGPIIDVPLLAGIYGLLHKFQDKILNLVLKIKLPKILLAMLISVPLLVIEENINCGAFECKYTFWPPTIYILLIFELVFLLISKKIPHKTVAKKAIYYSIFGMLFEFIFGVAREGLLNLAKTAPPIFIFIMIWVGFSYWFVIYLPLLVIQPKEN